MCLCGHTCVSAQAVSFHGTMQDRLELMGEHSTYPLFLQHSSCLPEA